MDGQAKIKVTIQRVEGGHRWEREHLWLDKDLIEALEWSTWYLGEDYYVLAVEREGENPKQWALSDTRMCTSERYDSKEEAIAHGADDGDVLIAVPCVP